MSSYDFKPPRIRSDELMPFVIKALKELRVMEEIVIMRPEIFTDEEDPQNVGRLQLMLKSVFDELQNDEIKGDAALARIEEQFRIHRTLIDGLIGTRSFPEVEALDNLR
jgi:hypothetical protein